MRLTRVVVALAGLLFLNGVVAGTSSAISPVVCQMPLLDLQADTYDSRAAFTNQADLENARAKLSLVWPRLTGAQAPPDTFLLLADFQTSLNALAAAAPPKLDPVVAQRLVGRAQEVIDCLNVNNP